MEGNIVVAAVRRPDGAYDGWVGRAFEKIQEVAWRNNPHIDKSTWIILPPEDVEARQGTEAFTSAFKELQEGAEASYLGQLGIAEIGAPAA